MRGKRRLGRRATALAFLIAAAALCAMPAVASAAPPGAPTIVSTNPASPSNNSNPLIQGTAEAASTVSVYTTADCTGTPLNSGLADLSGSWEVSVPVDINMTTSLYANAANGEGSGPCSSALAYTEDSIQPPQPTGLNTNPGPPSNNSSPFLKGAATGDSVSVSVYPNGSCAAGTAVTGSPVSPTTFANTGLKVSLPVTAPSDVFVPISANAKDAAGNVGGCTTFNYEYDSLGPSAPTLLNTNPASPSNNNNPFLRGTITESTATVAAYPTPDCSGNPVPGSGISPAAFASTGLHVAVPSDQPTTISARATDLLGNVGACAAITYVEDSTGPVAPTLLTTSPPSPSSSTNPLLQGATSADSALVAAYANGTCSGTPASTGSRAMFAAPGLEVIVPSNPNTNTITPLSARAFDALNNPGTCATIDYTQDSTLPTSPTLTSVPLSPANNNNPMLKGTSDPGTTVTVGKDTCTAHAIFAGTAAMFASGFTVPVNDNTTTVFSARATETSTNKSSCSTPLVYQEVTPGPGSGTAGVTTSKKCKKKKSKSASTAKKKKGKHCKKHKKHKKK